jgi:DNA-binding SARP family transcriptional activator
MIRFELLGRTAVVGPGGCRVEVRGEQPAITLARLALERPRPLTRHELAELLWPAVVPDRWEGPARQVVSRARGVLVRAGAPPSMLRSEAGHISLAPDEPVTTDVEDALDAADAARAALEAGSAGEAADAVEAALDALRLPFFPTSDAQWVAHWQQRLHDALGRALHVAARARVAAGRPDDAITAAEEALALDPFDEVATRALMAAHDARGSRAQALAAYERCRQLLDDELGVRPAKETERAYLVLLGPAPGASTVVAEATAPDRGAVALPFVGRGAELAALTDRWRNVDRDGGALAVVRGEAGIGKTRLVHELAALAAADGALVLWGDCVADVHLPFHPFTSIVSQLVAQRPHALDGLGRLRDDLARVVPGMERSAPRVRPNDEQARARAFRAVAAVFDAVAHERMLLVIDDAQWAGEDALALARHLAPVMADRPWLVCATLRHGEGAVAGTLADVARRVPATELALDGLDEAALAEMLELVGVGGREEASRLAPGVARRTAGNPFFVAQLVNDALARGTPIDLEGVPGAVAQHVVRRVETLDRPHGALLALAAVVGGDVDPALLEACAAEPELVLDRLEQLARERFLEERGPERFGFPHAIVRDAVLATVSATRRRRLHGRVGDALAARGADPAVVAHHLLAAGPARAADATTWLLAAGDEALRRGAWSVAGTEFANAARIALAVDDRIDARVGLGLAQRALGEPEAGRTTLVEALAEARARGRGRGAAKAIVALVGGGGRGVAVDLGDAARARLWREALAGLSDEDPLLVPVLGGLAVALVLTDAVGEREAICDRCVSAARAAADPELLASALTTRRVALMGPSGTRDRVRDGEEVLRADPDEITAESRLAALLGRVEDELELGGRDALDAALTAATRDAARLAHPYWSWATTSWRGLLALVDGRLDEAEALAHEAFAHQAPAHHPEAIAALGVNIVAVRMFQGRAGEVLDLLTEAARDAPNIPAYRAVLALALTLVGERAAAEVEYGWFADRDFALPHDSNWLIAAGGLAEAAVGLGDADGAAVLTGRLTPFADRHVVLNCYGGGGSYWGPVAYHLARLAVVRGDREAARRWVAQARAGVEGLRAESFRSRVGDLVRSLEGAATGA